MVRCPRCGELLDRKRVGNVELDGCHACGGAFFDAGELTTLAREPMQLAEVDRVFQVTERALKPSASNACPRCAVDMVRFEQPSLPGIELRACRSCRGIWLDGGEATEIARRRGATIPTREAPSAPPSPSPEPAPARSNRRLLRSVSFAAVLLFIAVILAGRSVALLAHEHATGRVIALDRIQPQSTWSDSRRHWSPYATVVFTTPDQRVTIRRRLIPLEILHVGDTIGVLYPADDPVDAHLDLFWILWGAPLFFVVAACMPFVPDRWKQLVGIR